jgi:hypothetical protein|tara:strand:- start:324 stop:560 length:237 start_codon:yes stop_codon:yes gene_type:complete
MKIELKIDNQVLPLSEKEIRLVEDGLYRTVMTYRYERAKNICKEEDGFTMNELGKSIYKCEEEIEKLRVKIDDAIGGA